MNNLYSEIVDFWNKEGCSSLDNLELLKKTEFIPFIGAGMSVPFGFGTWGGFLKEVINSFPDEDAEEFYRLFQENHYLQLAERINEYLNNGIVEKIRKRFQKSQMRKPENNYVHLLKGMGIKGYITTNYDTVIETNYDKANSMKIVLPDNCRDAIDLDRKGEPYLLKLHGTYDMPASIILTESQYKEKYISSGDIPDSIRYFWKNKTLLFLGCGLQKDYLVEYMHSLAGEDVRTWHYAILEMPATENKRKRKEVELTRLKIRPIWYPNGSHKSVYAILSMLFDEKAGSNFKDPIREKELSQNFECYIDSLAKSAFEKKKENLIVQAVLAQATEKKYQKKELSALSNIIHDFSEKCLLEIHGEPGTGKSTLLSLLYQAEQQMPGTAYPILIDLHYYDGIEMKRAQSQLAGHLERIEQELKKGGRVIIFIDGLNKYKRENDLLEAEICKKINKWKACRNVHFVYSIGVMPAENFPPFIQDIRVGKLSQSSRKILLRPLDVNSRKFRALLQSIISFYGIEPAGGHNGKKQAEKNSLFDKMTSCCKRVGGNYVEFRTVNFIANLYLLDNDDMFRTPIGRKYLQYYTNELGKDKLLETAEYVANFMLNRHDLPYPPTHYMVYKSPAMRDFLFAYYYVESIKSGAFQNLDIFDCVFTSCINRFIIDIFTDDMQAEDKIVKKIIECFERLSLLQKNQVLYVLGRIKTNKAKKSAREFLEGLYGKAIEDFTKVRSDKGRVMYFRTIGISLLYLEDYKYEDDFYYRLIYDSEVQEVNRNFHIIYYTTDNYKVGNELKLNNSIVCSGENIEMLYNFLYHSIAKKKEKNTLYINIVTLFNLVIYNHYQQTYKQIYNKEDFVKLLESLKTDTSITNQIVKDYILDISSYILENNVYAFSLEKIYQLKRTIRTGWMKTGREIDRIERPESVADHSWACCQLAQIFLTDRIEDCEFMCEDECRRYCSEYNREHIILLLLVHDLSEADTGDIPYGEKGKKDYERESKFIHSLRVLDSFPFYHSFENLDRLWREYDERKTYNAKIAFDLDKLEPLVQLYVYRKLLLPQEAGSVKDNWIQSVNGELMTQFGRKVFDFLEKYLLGKDFEI